VGADGTAHSPIAKFLARNGSRPWSRRLRRAGDLILVVADASRQVVPTCSDAFARSWACGSVWPIQTSWRTAGSSTSRCTNGTRKKRAGMRLTTRSAACCRRTRSYWLRVRDPYRPSRGDPAGRARAMQYDIALNGWELGGGSVRIHRRELLERSLRYRVTRSTRCTSCSRDSGSLRLRRAAARRNRHGHRPVGRALLASDEHSRGHGFPRHSPGPIDAGSPFTARSRAVR